MLVDGVADDVDQATLEGLSGAITTSIENFFPVNVSDMVVVARDITPPTPAPIPAPSPAGAPTPASSAHATGLCLTMLISLVLFADSSRA